jgi:uncharacterized protein
LVKLYVEERESAEVRSALADARALVTSGIAYVEARAAFARKHREGGLVSAEHRRVVEGFETDWVRYIQIDVNESLIKQAALLAEKHRLRAYDAIHLASARVARDSGGDPVLFASRDDELENAARREKFELLALRSG